MFPLTLILILITIPLWGSAIYVRLVFQDDPRIYFRGWQPKAALLVFTLIIIVIYFMPIFLDAQIAAFTRRGFRLFATVPCAGTAMIIFPEVMTALTGLDKVGVKKANIHKFYRGVGWIFLGGVFVLMWAL